MWWAVRGKRWGVGGGGGRDVLRNGKGTRITNTTSAIGCKLLRYIEVMLDHNVILKSLNLAVNGSVCRKGSCFVGDCILTLQSLRYCGRRN